MDLVLRARARVHELLAPREPAPQHAAALVRHPHRLKLTRPQQPRQRARVQPVGLRARPRDPGVIRADHDHPVDVRLEDPRDLPTAARHLQRHPIGPHQALGQHRQPLRRARHPTGRYAPRRPRRSRPRRSHGERPDRSLDRPTSSTPSITSTTTVDVQRENQRDNDTDGVGVGPGRGVGLSAGPFPRAALRTGRASSPASGSPRACRWSSGDQGLQSLEDLRGVALGAALRPWRRDAAAR